jgi:hypothetical protein
MALHFLHYRGSIYFKILITEAALKESYRIRVEQWRQAEAQYSRQKEALNWDFIKLTTKLASITSEFYGSKKVMVG